MPIMVRDDDAEASPASRPVSAPARRPGLAGDAAVPGDMVASPPHGFMPHGLMGFVSSPTSASSSQRRLSPSPAPHRRGPSVGAAATPSERSPPTIIGGIRRDRSVQVAPRRVSVLDTPPAPARERQRAGAARPKSAGSASARARTQSQGPPSRVETSAKDRVVVTVRKRPAKEWEKDVVFVQDGQLVQVAEPRQKVDLTKYIEMHKFNFHEAFDENCSNEFIYGSTVQPVVDFVLSGGNGTCLAFGQTGSGKTFTMLGDAEAKVPGLMVLGAQELLSRWTPHAAEQDSEQDNENETNTKPHMSVSMLEIYGDEVFDLLHVSRTRKKLIPREDASKKVRIQGLTRVSVRCLADVMRAVDEGSSLRCTAATGMNETSSRSHAIVQLTLHAGCTAHDKMAPHARQPTSAAQVLQVGEVHGSLSFVDLAGSEKGSDSANQDKQTRSEGAEINKSLLALKECIRAMDDPSSAFTPFRGSKLTLVLRDSFLGHGRILMLANVSPNAAHCGETVNTLRYAHRVKSIGRGGTARSQRAQGEEASKEAEREAGATAHERLERGEGRRASGRRADTHDSKDTSRARPKSTSNSNSTATSNNIGQHTPLQASPQKGSAGRRAWASSTHSTAGMTSTTTSTMSPPVTTSGGAVRPVIIVPAPQDILSDCSSPEIELEPRNHGHVTPEMAGETDEDEAFGNLRALSLNSSPHRSPSNMSNVTEVGKVEYLAQARQRLEQATTAHHSASRATSAPRATTPPSPKPAFPRRVPASVDNTSGHHRQQKPPAGGAVSMYGEFVAEFRAGVEVSMALLEHEVALLDAMERDSTTAHPSGSGVPLSEEQVEAIQSVLHDRIATATSLQMSLQKALRQHWSRQSH